MSFISNNSFLPILLNYDNLATSLPSIPMTALQPPSHEPVEASVPNNSIRDSQTNNSGYHSPYEKLLDPACHVITYPEILYIQRECKEYIAREHRIRTYPPDVCVNLMNRECGKVIVRFYKGELSVDWPQTIPQAWKPLNKFLESNEYLFHMLVITAYRRGGAYSDIYRSILEEDPECEKMFKQQLDMLNGYYLIIQKFLDEQLLKPEYGKSRTLYEDNENQLSIKLKQREFRLENGRYDLTTYDKKNNNPHDIYGMCIEAFFESFANEFKSSLYRLRNSGPLVVSKLIKERNAFYQFTFGKVTFMFPWETDFVDAVNSNSKTSPIFPKSLAETHVWTPEVFNAVIKWFVKDSGLHDYHLEKSNFSKVFQSLARLNGHVPGEVLKNIYSRSIRIDCKPNQLSTDDLTDYARTYFIHCNMSSHWLSAYLRLFEDVRSGIFKALDEGYTSGTLTGSLGQDKIAIQFNSSKKTVKIDSYIQSEDRNAIEIINDPLLVWSKIVLQEAIKSYMTKRDGVRLDLQYPFFFEPQLSMTMVTDLPDTEINIVGRKDPALAAKPTVNFDSDFTVEDMMQFVLEGINQDDGIPGDLPTGNSELGFDPMTYSLPLIADHEVPLSVDDVTTAPAEVIPNVTLEAAAHPAAPVDIAKLYATFNTLYRQFRNSPEGNNALLKVLGKCENPAKVFWRVPATQTLLQELLNIYRRCNGKQEIAYFCRHALALHAVSTQSLEFLLKNVRLAASANDDEIEFLRSLCPIIPLNDAKPTDTTVRFATALEHLVSYAIKWRSANTEKWVGNSAGLLDGRQSILAFLFKSLPGKRGGELTPCRIIFDEEGWPCRCENVEAKEARNALKGLGIEKLRSNKQGGFVLGGKKIEQFCQWMRKGSALRLENGEPFLLLSDNPWRAAAEDYERRDDDASDKDIDTKDLAGKSFIVSMQDNTRPNLTAIISKSDYINALSTGLSKISQKERVLEETRLVSKPGKIDTHLAHAVNENSAKEVVYSQPILPSLKLYQAEAADKAEQMEDLLLFLDTGLGKTITMLEILLRLYKKLPPGKRRFLVVGTSSTYLQTEERFKEYVSGLKGFEDLQVWAYKKGSKKWPEGDCIVLVKPGALKKDNIVAKLASLGLQMVFVDEAHELRNTKGKFYKNVTSLLNKCGQNGAEKPRLGLATATPFSNKIEDILALLQLLEERAAPNGKETMQATSKKCVSLIEEVSKRFYDLAKKQRERNRPDYDQPKPTPEDIEVERAALYLNIKDLFCYLESLKELYAPLMCRRLKEEEAIRKQWNDLIPLVQRLHVNLEPSPEQKAAFEAHEAKFQSIRKKFNKDGGPGANFLKFDWANKRIGFKAEYQNGNNEDIKRDLEKLKADTLGKPEQETRQKIENYIRNSSLLQFLASPWDNKWNEQKPWAANCYDAETVRQTSWLKLAAQNNGCVLMADLLPVGEFFQFLAKEKLGIEEVFFVHGSLESEERAKIIAQFERPFVKGQSRLLIMMKQACVGTDLPKNGLCLVRLTNDMNGSVDNQADNRIIRVGSDKYMVYVVTPNHRTPHELRIDHILLAKALLDEFLLGSKEVDPLHNFKLLLDYMICSVEYGQYCQRPAAELDELLGDMLRRAREGGLPKRSRHRYSIIGKKGKSREEAQAAQDADPIEKGKEVMEEWPVGQKRSSSSSSSDSRSPAKKQRTEPSEQVSHTSTTQSSTTINLNLQLTAVVDDNGTGSLIVQNVQPPTFIRQSSTGSMQQDPAKLLTMTIDGRVFQRYPMRSSEGKNTNNLLRALVSAQVLSLNPARFKGLHPVLTPEIAKLAETSITELKKDHPAVCSWLFDELQKDVNKATAHYKNNSDPLIDALLQRGYAITVWDAATKSKDLLASRQPPGEKRAEIHLLSRELPNNRRHYDLLLPV